MPKFLQTLQSKNFELQVWFVTTAVAGLRTLKAVIQDLISFSNPGGLLIDILILATFSAVCILIFIGKISKVPLFVGLILLVQVLFSYVQLGGLQGSTEYNLMGLGFLFVLVYKGRELVWLLIVYFILIAMVNLDAYLNGWLTSSLFNHTSTKLDNYFTTILTMLVLVVYFKNALIKESRRITELRTQLGRQLAKIRSQHRELEVQQRELHDANARLEQELGRHTRDILRQNKAIEDYIQLSTDSMHKPLNSITSEISALSDNSFLEKQLKIEVAELHTVINTITDELKHRKMRSGTAWSGNDSAKQDL